MKYRKFSADQLFDGQVLSGRDRVLITRQDGTVEEVADRAAAGGDIEEFTGILSPGLINCHCHTELSHLKNVIPPGTGLVDFLCAVIGNRRFPEAIILEAMQAAVNEMEAAGIVAVGDICNTADGIAIKQASSLRWHNFIEVLGFSDERAEANIARYQAVQEVYRSRTAATERTVLSPHAPYSISAKTFDLINRYTAGEVISMHSQEHPAEDELYTTGRGEFLKLYRLFGLEASPFPVSGKSSLQTCLPHFRGGQTLLLVHNTFMQEADMIFAHDYARESGIRICFCLCPGANLYIENRLPPVMQLLRHGAVPVLGTDSYSSNTRLNIAAEIKILLSGFPELSLQTVLQWATLNGAKALRMEDRLGSFEKGKKPGITLLETNLDGSRRLL